MQVAQPKLYNPRHPERTLLYQTIAQHYETWLELVCAGQFDGQGDHHTPKSYVRQAFAKYLECGIFAHGFARARFLRVIAQSLQTHSPGAAHMDKAALHLGAVVFIHRFSSDITCKQVSLHCNFVVASASMSMSTCTSAWSMGCLRKYRAALQAMTKPPRRT